MAANQFTALPAATPKRPVDQQLNRPCYLKVTHLLTHTGMKLDNGAKDGRHNAISQEFTLFRLFLEWYSCKQCQQPHMGSILFCVTSLSCILCTVELSGRISWQIVYLDLTEIRSLGYIHALA